MLVTPSIIIPSVVVLAFALMLLASPDFKLIVADKMLQTAVWLYWELRARAMAQDAGRKKYGETYRTQKRGGRTDGLGADALDTDVVSFNALKKFVAVETDGREHA